MEQSGIRATQLPNGVVLVIEPMADVQSAALALQTPAGSIYEPDGCNGTSAVLSELLVRGAGDRDSRELATELDTLGIQRSESVGWNFITLSAALLSDHLPAALDLYADIVLRPHLPEDEVDPARTGIEQDLLSIEDEPQRKALLELRRRCYDSPWGLPPEGTLDDLPRVTHPVLTGHFRRCFRPNGTIMAVAGNVDPVAVERQIERLFADWRLVAVPDIVRGARGSRIDHIEHDSSQTHIAIAMPSVPYSHPDYYAAWAIGGVLGGGSSSRLFTEVRERRGLCYSVYANHNTLLTEGRLLVYAGTTAERAQETLDVTLRELQRLREGIGDDELDRCKARAKSALVMQQESTSSRASAIARDWFHLGRVVTLDEIHERIEELTVARLLDYLNEHPAHDLTVLTMGPEPLDIGE
ncbi:MAG: insulinase family protein [Planctomycetaceae bacterium]|nr:insulinase family protein [Planctomycetaceae bacterium]